MSDSKIKLGIIGDAGAPTGFATVTHNVIEQLTATGDYEIECIAINFDGRPNQWSQKYKLWPARLGGDLLGIGLVPRFVQEFKPDAMMFFQDFWNIPMYMGMYPQEHRGILAYYPVDAPNIKGSYILSFGATTATACYTKFGVEESVRAANEVWEEFKTHSKNNNLDVVDGLQIQVGGWLDPVTRQPTPPRPVNVKARRLQTLKYPDGYHIIPHGVDTSQFNPISKKGSRKASGLPLDGFFIGNVNRNQSRKRLDLTIRAFAKFAATRPDARLIIHAVASDGQGWDLDQLSKYYGCRDKVIFTHNIFDNATATVEQLNRLYNTFDVQINTGGGEGWGLTAFEGAACRIPQIVPDWSCTKEIWEGYGKLIKVASVRHEPALINTMQCVIDTDNLCDTLAEFYENPSLREEVGNKCYEVTQRPEYRWEHVGKLFDNVFKKIAGKPPAGGPVAMSAKGQIELQKHKVTKTG